MEAQDTENLPEEYYIIEKIHSLFNAIDSKEYNQSDLEKSLCVIDRLKKEPLFLDVLKKYELSYFFKLAFKYSELLNFLFNSDMLNDEKKSLMIKCVQNEFIEIIMYRKEYFNFEFLKNLKFLDSHFIKFIAENSKNTPSIILFNYFSTYYLYDSRKINVLEGSLNNSYFFDKKDKPNLLKQLLDRMDDNLFFKIVEKIFIDVDYAKILAKQFSGHLYELSLNKSGGSSQDNWSRFTNIVLQRVATNTNALSASRKLPIQLNDISREAPINIDLDTLLPEWNFLRIQGRTILLKNSKGDILALKIQKEKEDKFELYKECYTTRYLKENQTELNLKSYFPEAVGIYENPDILEWLKKNYPDFAENYALNSLMDLVGKRENYTIYQYKVEKEHVGYFTYVYQLESDQEFSEACYNAISDYYTLLSLGIVFPQLVDMFHESEMEEAEKRQDNGYYVVLINLLTNNDTGSGEIEKWKEGVEFPNIREEGGADWGDFELLEKYIGKNSNIPKYMDAYKKHGDKSGSYILANIIAEYLYVFFMLAGRRAYELGKQNKSAEEIKAIWQRAACQVVNNCIQGLSICTSLSKEQAGKFLLANINIQQLANQMQFWMTTDYIPPLKRKLFPEKMYDDETCIKWFNFEKYQDNFSNAIGFTTDNVHQNLGACNGQEPIKEFNKLMYWMVSGVFLSYSFFNRTYQEMIKYCEQNTSEEFHFENLHPIPQAQLKVLIDNYRKNLEYLENLFGQLKNDEPELTERCDFCIEQIEKRKKRLDKYEESKKLQNAAVTVQHFLRIKLNEIKRNQIKKMENSTAEEILKSIEKSPKLMIMLLDNSQREILNKVVKLYPAECLNYIAASKSNIHVELFLNRYKEEYFHLCESRLIDIYKSFIISLENEHIETARLFIKNFKLDINHVLYFAIRTKYNKTAKSLIKNFDADVNAALYFAIRSNDSDDIEIATSLIDFGANVNAALFCAVENRDKNAIDLLIKKYEADVNHKDLDGWTPLYIASNNGYTDIVSLLLENEVSIDLPVSGGWSALHVATRNSNIEIVSLLIEKGASIDLTISDGTTALSMAIQEGNAEIVSLLLEKKANVNLSCSDGWTPLHFAAQEGHIKIVRLLLKAKANINVLIDTENGKMAPFDIALSKGHKEIAALLMPYSYTTNPSYCPTIFPPAPVEIVMKESKIESETEMVSNTNTTGQSYNPNLSSF